MRLTCPNCGAEYDVPEGLIPPAGKHVQCTDCHTRWFMRGAAREALSEDDILRKLEARNAPNPARMVRERTRPALVLSEIVGFPANAPGPVSSSFDWQVPPGAAAEVPEPVAEVKIESEPEPVAVPEPVAEAPARGAVGLPVAPARLPEGAPVAAVPAVLAAAAPVPALVAAAPEIGRTKPRLELPSAEEALAARPPARRGRGRFLPGVLLAVLIVGLALEVYVFRARLAEQVPAAAPALDGYGAAVDKARDWLRDLVEAPKP